jgi:hypothetical protein
MKMLARTQRHRIRFTLDHHPLIRSSSTKLGNSADPTLPIIALGHVRPNQTHHPRRSNPHSARGTATRSPIAVSFLGGFPTPAAQVRGNRRQWPASETLHRTGNPRGE